ncbi:MAG: TonB-dependent receptor [Steroidobacteraceae bacterium]
MSQPVPISRTVRALLAGSVLAAAGMASGVVLAQSDAQTEEMVEIVVTGTRIASPNATSSSPILALSTDTLRLQGMNDTGNLVDWLPQQITTGADLSNNSNPLAQPGGITTVNLRGLGPQRTLVLVDGRRLGVGDPNTGNPNPSPDINQIPAALIERIDVVTGGASAVYGSDAIAGVVNFIMRRDFEGVQIDAQYGFSQHNQHNDYMQGLLDSTTIEEPENSTTDGYSKSVNLLVGGNFADGKGNATAYLSYLDADPVKLANRDFAACQLQGNGTVCGGSSNSNRIQPLAGGDFAVSGNTLIPWSTANTTNPPPLFNSNAYMYGVLHQGERKQAGVLTRYDFNEHAEAYADFMITNDRAYTEIAPSGLFLGDVFTVHCNNTMLSDQQRTALGCPAVFGPDDTVDLFIGRRNIEGGPRQFLNEHTNYRGMVGLKGRIDDVWSYDAYGSYYYTTLYNTNSNYLSKMKSQSALDNCVDGRAGCVPWNIWAEGAVTQEATDYISTYGITNGTTSQQILSGSVTGDLGRYGWKLPTAADGVGVAFGVERRVDALEFLPDLVIGSGDLSGGSGEATTVDNSTHVTEGFVEFRVPLVQDHAGAQDLVFETGYRYSDYALSGGADTYKFGLQWQPIDSLRLRGSFNHAIRAPSLLELYTPQTVTQTSAISSDPCAPTQNGTVAAAASLEDCMRTGVTAAQYGNGLSTNTIPQCVADQCSTVLGGNPLLQPESADTISFGFTVTPAVLPDFTMSVDWYQIHLKGLVGVVPQDITLNGCLDGSTAVYCQNVVRGPAGILFGQTLDGGGWVRATNFNIAEGTFTGIDIQGSYRFGLGRHGSLLTSLNGVYLDETTAIPLPGAHEYDCAGLYGNTCGPAIPDWRHTLRLTWQMPSNVNLSAQWRYVAGVSHEQNTSDPTLDGSDVSFGGTLGARSYLDLTGSWEVNDTYNLRVGINNILDQDPPLVDTSWSGPGTANTWGPYDSLGRQVFLAMTARF